MQVQDMKYNSSLENPSAPVEAWMQGMEAVGQSSENHLDPELPAYTATEGGQGNNPSNGDCCAFNELDAYANGNANYLNLLQHSPKLRFLGWIILCRTTNTSLSAQDRLRCPMDWCQKQFEPDGYEELVKHLLNCSHFSDGSYVCPYHHRSEIFMEPKTSKRSLKSSKKRFLRHTLSAICRLGSKSIRKAMHPSKKICASLEEQTHREGNLGKRRRIEDTSTAELAVRGNVTELPATMYRLFEMEGHLPEEFKDAQRADLDSERLSCPSMVLESPNDFTPESSNSPISPETSPNWYSTHDFDSPISPTTAGLYAQSNMDVDYDELGTKETTFDMGLPEVPDSQTTLNLPSHNMWFNIGGKSPRLVPSIRIDTSCNPTRPVKTISPTSSEKILANNETNEVDTTLRNRSSPSTDVFELEGNATSPNKLVEDLRGLFNTLFKVSVAKICQSSLSSTISAFLECHPSAAFAFDRGFGALQKAFAGELPKDFWEVFGLSLLAYACALANEEGNFDKMFPEIFVDLLGWSQAISDDAERDNYINLVQLLWSPEGHSFGTIVSPINPSPSSSIANSMPSQLDVSNLLGVLSPPTSWPAATPAYVSGQHLSMLHREFRDETKLLVSLRTGVTFRLCSQFLETFEYLSKDVIKNKSRISGLESNIPSIRHPTQMWKYNYIVREIITDPLTESSRGLEGFQPVVDNTLTMLSQEPYTTLRDVELNLLQQGKARTKSQPLHRLFVDKVHELCEKASEIMGWDLQDRDQYYLQDIQKVSSIHKDLLLTEHALYDAQKTDPFSHVAERLVINDIMSMEHRDEPSSLQSHPHFPWTETYDPTNANLVLGHPGFLDNPDYDLSQPQSYMESDSIIQQTTFPYPEYSHNHPLPAPQQGSPTSALSVTSDSVEGTLTCDICGRVLQGKVAWLHSNLQRHKREKHLPSTKRLICPITDCKKPFLRNHNLKHHQRTVHGMKVEQKRE